MAEECNGPSGFLNAVCVGKDIAGGVVSGAANSAMEDAGDSMMAGYDQIMKTFLTSWLDVGILVDLEGSSVRWLESQLETLSIGFAVIGIMVAMVWTMVQRRGDKALKVAYAMFKVFLVGTLGTAIVQLLLEMGDVFSDWVLTNAGVKVSGAPTAMDIAPGLAILGGILGILATAIQWVIMLVRSAVVPLMVAVWPAVGGISMIEGAEEAFSKITKWLLAFILYKPVAAIVYAYAWYQKSGNDGLGGFINGLVLLTLAIFALPALLKLLAPGTSALGGAVGGGMAISAGAAAVTAAVAGGAAIASGGSSAAAGAGTAGSVGQSGAAGSGGGSVAGGGAGASGGGAGASGGGVISGGGGSNGNSGSGSGSGGPVGGSGSEGGAGRNGSDGSTDGSGPAGAAGSSGSSAAGSGSQPASSGGQQSRSGGRASAGQAAAESAGRSVADGAKDSDGKDVIGE